MSSTKQLLTSTACKTIWSHDDVIKWKHFLRYWPFVRGIHRYPVNSPQKGQWREALMFFFISVWINGWVNNGKAGDLRRYRAHYDVTVMLHDVSECQMLQMVVINSKSMDVINSEPMQCRIDRLINALFCLIDACFVSNGAYTLKSYKLSSGRWIPLIKGQ